MEEYVRIILWKEKSGHGKSMEPLRLPEIRLKKKPFFVCLFVYLFIIFFLIVKAINVN